MMPSDLAILLLFLVGWAGRETLFLWRRRCKRRRR